MASVEMNYLTQEFCAAFAGVFQQNAGEALALQSAASQPSAENNLGYRMRFSGAVCGTLSAWMDLGTGAVLAARLLGDPVDENLSPQPEHEDAVTEIMNQVAGAMATALRERFGETGIAVERMTDAIPAAGALALRPADGTENVLLLLLPDADLAASLSAGLSGTAAAPDHAQADLANAGTSATPSATAPAKQVAAQKNLELVMDVELDLTLRFGRRVMMLSEITDLTSGSVIELDRVVDEPVELLLGERVIAKGEVVIVDGNYGLRVTELAAPEHAAFLSA